MSCRNVDLIFEKKSKIMAFTINFFQNRDLTTPILTPYIQKMLKLINLIKQSNIFENNRDCANFEVHR